MVLAPGQVLKERYRIVKLLGQGGFGAVYRAWDITFAIPCALKENLETGEAAQRQFLREARLLRTMRHPNLPQVTDYFVLPGLGQYLVMDYIEGQDLGEMLVLAGRPLPEAQILDWAGQICDALSYLHSQNPPVIHRDIKPANIKITPQGQAVLVDFGIAKIFDPHVKTTMGAQAITPGYSPPEQYGLGATDARSDLYALGATLYHLLSGATPPASVDLMSGVVPPLLPLQQINPGTSPAVSAAIERAMRINRAERFGSAAEFHNALLPPAPVHPRVEEPVVKVNAGYTRTQVAPAMPPVAAPHSPAASKSAVKQMTKSTNLVGLLAGLVVAIILAYLAREARNFTYIMLSGRLLEYPFLALVIGLLANWFLKAIRVYEFLKPGFRSGLFLKIGVVLLGTSINFRVLITPATGAIILALIVTSAVYIFSWWLGGKFGLSRTLRAVMSAAISISGVLAAIMAAGAVAAKKEEIAYVTTLVIITALPLMVISPLIASSLNMSESIAGAWFGSNIESTVAAISTGTIYGEAAQQVASIVKSTQNALTGVAAILLALYFSIAGEGNKGHPSAALTWQRFPKPILGFIIVSLPVTFGLLPYISYSNPNAGNAIAAMRDWALCLAFVCLGLEISMSDMKQMGAKPVWVYLIVTAFSTVLALIVSWVVLGWFFPIF